MNTVNNFVKYNSDEEQNEFQYSISGELGKIKGIVKHSKTNSKTNIKITETDLISG